ncbi:MAG: biopolymer transporter ExbD [candidate division WOR-3 bacterium]|nr:MAG: biopolymer transporter ExbD [candidate division WOR-3 bacterium]
MNNKGLISEINITSLADVSITLLVIFIITAPMMTPGIDVNLPRTDASLPHDEEGVTVSVNKELQIFVDNEQVQVDNFEAKIRQIINSKPPGIIIYLRADKEVDYGFVVEIVGRLRKAGVKELGLVAEIPQG